MLTDILSIAWVTSAAVYLFVYWSRREMAQRIFQPSSTSVRVVMFVIVVLSGIGGVAYLAGFRTSIAGMQLIHWAGFFLLCYLWVHSLVLTWSGSRTSLS